jgi:hypothetical protein
MQLSSSKTICLFHIIAESMKEEKQLLFSLPPHLRKRSRLKLHPPRSLKDQKSPH